VHAVSTNLQERSQQTEYCRGTEKKRDWHPLGENKKEKGEGREADRKKEKVGTT